ncbi:hypothetical protein IJJ97_06710 [bacterium]|nr:hypothetical protein [bacterium]
MNKIKFSDRIIFFVFFAFLILPNVLWFFLEPNADKRNIENRVLRSFPKLNGITVKQFPKDFDGFYSDNLPFRNYFVKFYSFLQYNILKDVESDRVLFAKDGWMFYKNVNDGDPIPTYKKIDSFSNEELIASANSLVALKKYCEERNCKFVFFIAPNKENIYSEYMPDFIKRTNGMSRTEQLIWYLKNNTDIKPIYPDNLLKKAKDKYVTYYKYDTHWNSYGGFCASSFLLEKLDKPLPNKDFVVIHDEESNGRTAEIGKGYDLAKLVGMQDFLKEPYKFEVSKYENYPVTGGMASANEISRYSCEGVKTGKLFMIRDSFGESMAPVLGSAFRNSSVMLYYYFDKKFIDVEKPDIFIYEVAERYLPRVAKDEFDKK